MLGHIPHANPALSDDMTEGEDKSEVTFRFYQNLIGTLINDMLPSEGNAMWTD